MVGALGLLLLTVGLSTHSHGWHGHAHGGHCHGGHSHGCHLLHPHLLHCRLPHGVAQHRGLQHAGKVSQLECDVVSEQHLSCANATSVPTRAGIAGQSMQSKLELGCHTSVGTSSALPTCCIAAAMPKPGLGSCCCCIAMGPAVFGPPAEPELGGCCSNAMGPAPAGAGAGAGGGCWRAAAAAAAAGG